MKKNFMKKIAALITAASMAASLGTAAFAANYDGTGIKINVDGVNVSPAKVEGVYSVKVDYTVSDGVTNNIGVTMVPAIVINVDIVKNLFALDSMNGIFAVLT